MSLLSEPSSSREKGDFLKNTSLRKETPPTNTYVGVCSSNSLATRRGTRNGQESDLDVTKTRNGERRAGSGERKSGNELSAETSTKIQNGGPKNEREKEEDKERNSCLV